MTEPFLFCTVFEEDEVTPLKLSALMEMEETEIFEQLIKTMMDGVRLRMLRKNQTMDLVIDWEEYEADYYDIFAIGEMKECYLFLKEKDGEEYALFKTGFTSDGSLELVAEEVGNVELVTDKGIYYLKESDGQIGELYVNSQKIDSDVKAYSCKESEGGDIFYVKDPDEKAGTLCKYENDSKEKIADDVAAYVELEDGSISFLTDYNFSKCRGDLSVYRKGKISHVDSDVSCILN